MARISLAVAVTVGLVVGSGTAHADQPVQTANPTFQTSLDRIAKRSALWRAALDGLRESGRRVIVLTPDQVVVSDGRAEGLTRLDGSVLAEVAPVPYAGSRIDVVIVVVNLALLEERHREQRLLPVEFDMDLDRILVHEIYGHAIPYLQAGDLSGRCPDPQPRERATDACSIRRENAVREELGLGRRTDYGLGGLNVAWRR